jgi:DnaA-homolog protein
MKQLLLDIQPAPKPSLQNFVAGQNNEAIASISALLNGFEMANSQLNGFAVQDSKLNSFELPNFIYLWGAAGSGKTHLLQAAKAQGANIADDVHSLNNDAQIALFNQFNQLKEVGKILITSGLHAPTQMGLRDDLATRLAWGLVYQLHPLTDIEKAQALKNHAFERGMKLPDDVADYCLRHMRRDLPTLMATLDALDEWSLITKKPVTVPMLKKLLQLDLNL